MQTFFKSISGHKIEFNRMLYPVSYHISTKDIEFDGATFSLLKDQRGAWNLVQKENVPKWLNEISFEVNKAIVENEATMVSSLF